MTSAFTEMIVPPGEEVNNRGLDSAWPDAKESSVSTDLNSMERATEALPIARGLPSLLYELAVRLPSQPDIKAFCVWLYEPVRQFMRLHILTDDLSPAAGAGTELPMEDSVAEWVWKYQRPLTIDATTEKQFPAFVKNLLGAGIKSFCAVPLLVAGRRIGVWGFVSEKPHAFCKLKLEYVQRLGSECVNLADGFSDLLTLKRQGKPNKETPYLGEQIRPEDEFEGIIGRSASLRAVLDQVQIVAPTDSTVLIFGETGTGKELIARAIHNRSLRRERPFVRVNCAAIPSGLLESELFGHERGAFTGAVTRKIGRFELAHGGTLFLDEIGDTPVELQPKLLRVLQEREFERLGSSVTTRVDVRIVAATSRDLLQMVASREFRSDLYYRLNVFPVCLPALRERSEDIALLVRHFVGLCAKRLGRNVERIPREVMEVLLGYSWPGNVRELQNFVERAVILSPGKVLRAPLNGLKCANFLENSGESGVHEAMTLKEAEREHILQALAETNWVIGGPRGAAARLGLQRTTLISKMQRLGISRAQA